MEDEAEGVTRDGEKKEQRETIWSQTRIKGRERGGRKLDEKGSKRATGMKPKRDYSRRERKPEYLRFH